MKFTKYHSIIDVLWQKEDSTHTDIGGERQAPLDIDHLRGAVMQIPAEDLVDRDGNYKRNAGILLGFLEHIFTTPENYTVSVTDRETDVFGKEITILLDTAAMPLAELKGIRLVARKLNDIRQVFIYGIKNDELESRWSIGFLMEQNRSGLPTTSLQIHTIDGTTGEVDTNTININNPFPDKATFNSLYTAIGNVHKSLQP